MPAHLPVGRRRQALAVRLHPHDREAAVLDDLVSPGELEAIDADPRWRGAALPTDRGVAGRWRSLAALAAGLVLSVAFVLLIAAALG